MSQIKVEITDASEFHCFQMTLNAASGEQIQVMLHARALVDLIHQSSLALCEWQRQTTTALLQQATGLSEAELRAKGIIA